MKDATYSTIEIGQKTLTFLRHLPNFVRLYWRLFRDPRVSLLAKGVLIAAATYLALPVDLVPDLVPVLGQLDDIAVLIGACKVFIQLCPPDVVEEHVRRIARGG
jgi:uncharacterized membrane protein YkvA (DUF1232 family)